MLCPRQDVIAAFRGSCPLSQSAVPAGTTSLSHVALGSGSSTNINFGKLLPNLVFLPASVNIYKTCFFHVFKTFFFHECFSCFFFIFANPVTKIHCSFQPNEFRGPVNTIRMNSEASIVDRLGITITVEQA